MRLKVISLSHSLPKDVSRDKTTEGNLSCTHAQPGTYPLAFQTVNKAVFIIEFGIHFYKETH